MQRTGHILTPRQREIIELMIRDYSDKMVAAELNISINTVKAFKNLIYKILGVHSSHGAVGKYLRDPS